MQIIRNLFIIKKTFFKLSIISLILFPLLSQAAYQIYLPDCIYSKRTSGDVNSFSCAVDKTYHLTPWSSHMLHFHCKYDGIGNRTGNLKCDGGTMSGCEPVLTGLVWKKHSSAIRFLTNTGGRSGYVAGITYFGVSSTDLILTNEKCQAFGKFYHYSPQYSNQVSCQSIIEEMKTDHISHC